MLSITLNIYRKCCVLEIKSKNDFPWSFNGLWNISEIINDMYNEWLH